MLKSKEKGTAILELALVAPFFLVLLLCVFDISRCIVIHSQLVVAAKEGLRNSANINYMEPLAWRVKVTDGSDPLTDAYETNSGPPTPVWGAAVILDPLNPPGPVRLLSNTARIVRAKLPQLEINPDDWQIESEVDYGINPNQVRVEITVKYVGIFPLFDGMDIAVKVMGPYIT